MDLIEKTVSTEEIFDGKVVRLRIDTVELPDGKIQTREVLSHPGGVGVIALDEDNNVLMVRQFRPGAKRVMLEIPAGKLEYGENPEECGKRELSEETGFCAGEFTHLAKFYVTPAYCEEIINIYFARNLKTGKQHLDDGEFLNVERIAFDKLYDMVINNEITDGKTIIAVLKLKELLNGQK